MQRLTGLPLAFLVLLLTSHLGAQTDPVLPGPATMAPASPATTLPIPPEATSPAAPMPRQLSMVSPIRDVRAWENEPLPRRDIFDMLSATSAPAPASYWIDREKEVFGKLLAQRKANLFVAPIQIQGYGLNRVSRSLMLARLVERIDIAGPDPYVVQRAAGDGARSISRPDLYTLAGAVDARRMLVIHVGYERRDHLVVTARLDVRKDAEWWRTESVKSWTAQTFDDENLPASAFRALIPEILEFAAIAPAPVRAPGPPAKSPGLPRNMLEAQRFADKSPLSRALMLQWLGTLSPSTPARQRERLFEQALVALDAGPDPAGVGDGLVALLRARSLYYLNSRPAALSALGAPATPEGQSVQHLLNGNLPQMEAVVAKVADPLLRLMLEIDLQDMRDAYDLPVNKRQSAYVESTLTRYPEWNFLVTRRTAEGNVWLVQDNLAVKLVLDREFPIRGFEAEAMGRGAMTLGKAIDMDEIGSTVFEHVNRARLAEGSASRCPASSAVCLRNSYLDVLEAIAVSNAVRGLHLRSEMQGLSEAAAQRADKLSRVLDGQPDFLAMRGRVYVREVMRTPQGGHSPLDDEARRVSGAAAYLEHGQSAVSATALGYTAAQAFPYRIAYGYDFPPSSFWLAGGQSTFASSGGRLFDRKSALAYSTFAIDALEALMASKEPEEKQLAFAELEQRFRGHPRRTSLMAQNAVGVDAQIARMEAARNERPDLWENYSGIARRQIEQKRDYAAAARTYRSFPGFNNRSSYDSVALSNYAYEAGSIFFWSDHLDDAKKFYKISADLRTGSDGSLASALRLELLNGDYEKTAELSLKRASRYDSAYAYRDYLSWLFAMGYGSDAWAGFDQLHGRLENPQVWLAAHVGHRMERKSWTELRSWLLSEPIGSSGFFGYQSALTYAVMLNSIDRTPAPDLPELLAAIEGKPKTVTMKGSNTIAMPHPVADGSQYVNRSAFRVTERGPFKEEVRVPSQQYLFALGYLALRSGKFDEAIERFDKMAEYYPIEGHYISRVDSYALGYFSWASAKTGDPLGLERFLSGLPEPQRRFDYHLGMAFFTGLRGDLDASVTHLDLALATRPFTESRPIFTEYQWAEACDWLFEATGNTKYRDKAIKWAKANQKVQPMYAWAYAMEAKLTTSDADRIRALGFTLYFDPLSDRIARFPAATRQRAKTWFAANDPFKPTVNETKKRKA